MNNSNLPIWQPPAPSAPNGTQIPFSGPVVAYIQSLLSPQLAALQTASLGLVNVTAYGKNVGTGGDDSAAFVAAMAVVNASPHQVLYIPPGSYTYNQTVNGSLTFTQQQSEMIGAGRASSEITFTGTSGVGVVMSAANGYQSISGVFLYSATSTTSSLVSWTAGSYGAVYDAVLYTSGSAALSVTQNSAIDFALDNVILAITGATAVGLTCQPGPSQIRATNFLIIGTNLSGQTGILFPSATSLDTGTFSAFMIAGVGTGIAMLPGSGGVCGDLYFSDAFVANTIQALYMNPTSPGTIQRASFDNVWFDSGIASSGNQVVNIAGSGSIYDVSFNHCRMVGAVTAGFIGVYIHNTATPLVRITDCMVEIQSSYGIYVGNDCKLQINGGRIAQCGYALAFNSATGWTNNKSVFGLDVSDTTNTAPG